MEITQIVINPRMALSQKRQLLSKHKNLTVIYDTSISVAHPQLRDCYGNVKRILNQRRNKNV